MGPDSPERKGDRAHGYDRECSPVDARSRVCPMPTIRLGQAIRNGRSRPAVGEVRRPRLKAEHRGVVQRHQPRARGAVIRRLHLQYVARRSYEVRDDGRARRAATRARGTARRSGPERFEGTPPPGLSAASHGHDRGQHRLGGRNVLHLLWARHRAQRALAEAIREPGRKRGHASTAQKVPMYIPTFCELSPG